MPDVMEIVKKNIYQKIQRVRVEIQNSSLKMSGNNTYSNYKYFELGDFLPAINKFCDVAKLYTQFNIRSSHGEEKAILQIINAENPKEMVTFTSKTAEVKIGAKKDGTGGAEPIQNLGGKITYMRRYMMMMAFEIIESDIVERVNSEVQISGADQNKFSKAKTKEELSEVYNSLKHTYKSTLILSAYKERLAQIEDSPNKIIKVNEEAKNDK